MRGLSLFLPVLLTLALGQEVKESATGDAQKLVTIKRIIVEGTRLPALSVVSLAQVKAGDQVNFIKLHSAMQKVTKSGLISNIDFEYESVPDKETDVILHLKCTDVPPVAIASIRIAKLNEDDVWKWLKEVDPLFTREMPPNEAAIQLYAHWIGKYMESHGEPNFLENFSVVADATNASGGTLTDRLSFKAVKRRTNK